jgi:outer membrane protein TolC
MFMSRYAPLVGFVLTAALIGLTGCQPQQPFYLHQVDEDLSHYKGVATEISVPDVDSDRLADVAQAQRPFSLLNNDPKNFWDLTLEEAMRTALTNNKIMRNIGGQIQGPPDFILRNPEVAPSIYGPALAEANPRTGVEAALSAFDAQFASSLSWQRTNTPENVNPLFTQAGVFANISEHDIANFQAQLTKVTATGGQFSVAHIVAYDMDRFAYPGSAPYNYPSDWNVKLEASMRQPLLQGAGVQFNRIAGPGAQPGVFNGVVLARINTDIALADFESSVRNLISDVEVAYWELYFTYRNLDAARSGYDSALATWRKIYTLNRIGSKGGEAEKEAQARQQVYVFRSTAEQSLSALYATESKLRYLLGLSATDGRLIRPKDEPTTALVRFDWYEVLNEALARNVELRQQKWIVKRRELELIAAKNFLLPKVDFVALYRWLGLGNDLLPVPNGTGGDFTQDRSNAYQSMTNGAFQEWQVGFQANIPLGFQKEMAGVRFAQMSLVQEQAKLQEGELELSHQLAFAIRDMETAHVLSKTNFQRRISAQREVEAVTASYENDTVTIDRVLEAQQRLAQAESDYYRSLANYAKAITQVHFRKGSLLEYNGVYLAEGPWPAKAYFDASRRARARDASMYLDYGFTQPRILSRGPLEQQPGEGMPFDGSQETSSPTLSPNPTSTPTPTPAPASDRPELVPTPEPEPMRPGTTSIVPVAPLPAEEMPHSPAIADAKETRGWNAVMAMPSAVKKADRQVVDDHWITAEKASYDEPSVNPPAASVDRPASGWKGIQR